MATSKTESIARARASVPARDRVLEAFEALLISDGERASTLDAVAARAGVSKGGLLYHFASKEALIDGLLHRLDALVADDIDRMRTAEEGALDYFVRTSVASLDGSQNALERTIVACSCLAQGAHPRVRESLRSMQNAWVGFLKELIDDPVVARLVMLVSDGLYFSSATGLSDETPDSESMDDLVALLKEITALRAP